ncbi:MAG: ribonuclease domain-containing protein [Propionibacteriaceae bacterium]
MRKTGINRGVIIALVMVLAAAVVSIFLLSQHHLDRSVPTRDQTKSQQESTSKSNRKSSSTTGQNVNKNKQTDNDSVSGLAWIDSNDLPKQAQETLELIDKGGPYPYPGKDGSTYRNLSKILPVRKEGYYREYTVKTPGESDRGARRIVVGDNGEFYWTADHYDTFSRIRR